MTIRPMLKKDRPTIRRILKNTPEFLPIEVAVAEEVMDAYLDDPTGSGYPTLVAEEDGQVAGYVSYGPAPMTDGTWDIYWIAVDRAVQGKGIGRRLMQAAETEIARAKGRLILLDTSSKPGYERTNAFYRGIGYREACRVRDYYMVGDDRVTYEKRLEA